MGDVYDSYLPHDPYRSHNAAVQAMASAWRVQGLHPVFHYDPNGVIGPKQDRIDHYACRRGCGTLVWDPDAHIKNVCTKFEPVAGGTS